LSFTGVLVLNLISSQHSSYLWGERVRVRRRGGGGGRRLTRPLYVRRLVAQDLVLLGVGHEARAQVHTVAHDGVLLARLRAHDAAEHAGGRDADLAPQAEVVQVVPHEEGGRERALRIVAVDHGGQTEHDEHQGALVVHHHLVHGALELRSDEGLGERVGASGVSEAQTRERVRAKRAETKGVGAKRNCIF
jgi:hypothetical protein